MLNAAWYTVLCMSSIYHSDIFFKVFDFVCTIRMDLTSRKMAKILLNFPLCVSAKREKCSIRHGAKIYRWHYWGIYQAIQQDRVFEIYHNINKNFFLCHLEQFKVWVFWEDHKIWKNLRRTFDKSVIFCAGNSVLVKKLTKIF